MCASACTVASPHRDLTPDVVSARRSDPSADGAEASTEPACFKRSRRIDPRQTETDDLARDIKEKFMRRRANLMIGYFVSATICHGST
jgi:hypothetical protein